MAIEMTAAPTEDTLGPLLNVLAQSLDVREVFNQISAVARQTVPHDHLMFGLITADGEHYRILASSEDESQAALAEVPLSALSRRLLKEDFASSTTFERCRERPGGARGRCARLPAGSTNPSSGTPICRGLEATSRGCDSRFACEGACWAF